MGEFLMPALGADMSAGTLIEWQKQPGDSVERGDIIAVVHTDKADVEVETFTTGVLEKLLVEPGTEVPVGTPLAVIREEGKPAPAVPGPPPPAVSERLLISPSARHLAHELGVDLAALHGSGPGGRIQRKDVEAAARPAAPVPPEAPAAPVPPEAPARPAPPPADERQAAMRRAIAAAMARSKREIPHFYLAATVDMSNAVRWLAEENLRRDVPDRLLHGVLLIKAVALALREFPELNATWRDEQVVPGEGIHVGVAVSLRGGGLVAPAIHDTDRLSLDELMHALRSLTSRARAGSLRSSELSDPTITVTSIGERGVESLYGVIFPPQVAIVGFGKLVERPWVSKGQVLPCPVVTATVS
ncbi:MAG TPA: dihydrolipoamide acetyltransferase family protein, partial [Gaiellaceae bacterium]|nr:dihydrolipoamide acetyltransferase family protein [Gaiellaceae bacterium]